MTSYRMLLIRHRRRTFFLLYKGTGMLFIHSVEKVFQSVLTFSAICWATLSFVARSLTSRNFLYLVCVCGRGML